MYEEQRQEPYGENDSMTEGWQIDLKKGEEGDVREKKDI